MSDAAVLAETTSLCPDCLERVPGRYEVRNDQVHLSRDCPDHGVTRRQVWGSVDHWEWAHELAGGAAPEPTPDQEFAVDNDHACLAVVEVTESCNLSCSFCFASSGPSGAHRPTEEVLDLLETVKRDGEPRPVQFSGGEPTVRDDLPDLIERAREMDFSHIEVNTNGIRLGTEDGYARRLADAGVTAVYLQFDGLSAEANRDLREVDLVAEKRAAVEACREAGLSVVLVPTVVPDVNDDEMADVVRFAMDNLDVVESINFQPVAQFGRYEEHGGRFSLDQAAAALADQLDALGQRDFLPIPCCSATCQMASVLVEDDGEIRSLAEYVSPELYQGLSSMIDERDWLELMAQTELGSETVRSAAGCCGDTGCCGDGATGLSGLPDQVTDAFGDALPVSFTGFMDAAAADAGKLSNCCVSVPTGSGELVPFCAYNMTTDDGEYAIRNRNDWGGRDSVGAPSSFADRAADATAADLPDPDADANADATAADLPDADADAESDSTPASAADASDVTHYATNAEDD
ncbi:MAG: radical SAM protein [Haloglomus sp.]